MSHTKNGPMTLVELYFHPCRIFQLAYSFFVRASLGYCLHHGVPAKNHGISLRHNPIAHALLDDLIMIGIQGYLRFVDLCTMQWRLLVLFGIQLEHLLHHL